MQKLLTFLLFTLVFIAGYMGFIKAMWSMMQDGGAFDVVFKWSKLRDKLYAGSSTKKLLENAIGGCEQCTSFWWVLPWMAIYTVFCVNVCIWPIGFIASVIWCLVFWFICSMAGHWILTHKNAKQ